MTKIPAKHAEIFWNQAEPIGLATDMVVVDRRLRFPLGQKLASITMDQYRNSRGAMEADWCGGEDPQASPEGVFAAYWLDRCQDRAAIKQALVEFAKIEECAWARTMLKVLDGFDRMQRGDPRRGEKA